MTDALTIAGLFSVDSAPLSAEPYGSGHINATYLVQLAPPADGRVILQRINRRVFSHIAALMENVANVTAYLRRMVEAEGGDPRRECLRLIPARDGAPMVMDEEGEYWRAYVFVERTVTLQTAQTPEQLHSAGLAFGRFQRLLNGYPAADLHEVIPHFHDTASRYQDFERAVAADVKGRAAAAQKEIDFVRARHKETGRLVSLLQRGELPLRVTHNDTKLNNVLLDEESFAPVCVIDLDTVMPGLSLYDFGDGIRVGASTAAEDETDLSRVSCDLALFEGFTHGFLSECGALLTDQERALLPFGAKLMTYECGMRFLADYLEGDTYFRIHRPGQNLDRCRTQFRLVADMETKMAEMEAIVARCL
ncbi:MAG: aminoglycoside phosphotransferase family protein [Clostridiales bacterium]|nr:aminoglycoside phosphotransferase family protein [Clostridiales bacterium]